MISHSQIYRARASLATHYYADQADDYYSRDGGAATWQGDGARRLGAVGEIDPARFKAMLQGDFGRNVTAGRSIRKDAKARAALDLTFGAPKSITLQALIGGDERLIHANDQAVTAALAYVEQHLTMGRHKENGKSRVEQTGNLIIAKFRHETARPTEDAAPDPHLHVHALLMNLTQRADDNWVSLSNEAIFKLLRVTDSIYQAELERNVRALGYAVRHEKNHIELAHITREQIEFFSKRSAGITAELTARGTARDNAPHALRQGINLAHRQEKTQVFSRAELHQQWREAAATIGMQFDQARHDAERQAPEAREISADLVAQASLDWAIQHLAERESVMPLADLLHSAVRHAGGHTNITAIQAAIQGRVASGALIQEAPHYSSTQDKNAQPMTREGWAAEVTRLAGLNQDTALQLVDDAIAQGRLLMESPRYATRKAHEAESRILAAEQTGRGAWQSTINAADAENALDTLLTPGQREAVMLITTGSDQVAGIQGLAGTGKSFALQNAQTILREQGHAMTALAPYGNMVRNLRQDGIAANTIASILAAADKRPFLDSLGPTSVVVIDEAGVVPVRQMDKLLALIQPTGAKVVLLGDTAQTKAIEAGRAFAMLQEQGMKTVLMGDIQRQRSARLRQAVELAATGRASHSLPLLNTIRVIPDEFTTDEHGRKTRDSSARYEAIAKSYTGLTATEQANTIVVTGTNASRNAINRRIHALLGLEGKGRPCQLLARHDTTRAERSVARYYTVGDIVIPERDYKCGLKRGELYRVTGSARHDRINVLPFHADPTTTQPIEIIPKTMSKLSVYHLNEAELSVADHVRITRNDAQHDLVNGQLAKVVAIDAGSVTLETQGRHVQLPTDRPLNMDYAYATTAHSAQGLTCDRVLYNAESFSRTTAQDTYYVSISRERHEVTVFTDDAEKLPERVDRQTYKGLAHDLQPAAAKVFGQDEKELAASTLPVESDLEVD
ncbi:MobF family relaxase [Pollutimonas thiosulfatoxidans]|uniref:Conjugal transfer protein n=1 Tax=Pollutimonas thiosulfatoxidans TaxID=2028345 RepID=A0A410GDP8_9BURK|nr:MobF family relaxase [Pollutimonas thiosulfatoxidans]QAA94427.1 conjugal transfer protein [Pollutimonas thiosulfatoxidans]